MTQHKTVNWKQTASVFVLSLWFLLVGGVTGGMAQGSHANVRLFIEKNLVPGQSPLQTALMGH